MRRVRPANVIVNARRVIPAVVTILGTALALPVTAAAGPLHAAPVHAVPVHAVPVHAVPVHAVPVAASASGWTSTALPWTIPGPLPVIVNDVACPKAGTCFGVGAAGAGMLITTLTDGTWTDAIVAPPSGDTSATLFALQCLSLTACTAVGTVVSAGKTLPLVATWAHGTWTAVALASPGPSGGTLHAVACSSVTSCVAVGAAGVDALVETLSSGTWTPVTLTPQGDQESVNLRSVSCATTSPCLAVGWTESPTTQGNPVSGGFVATRAGTTWSGEVLDPSGGSGSTLQGLTCTRKTCTAVGTLGADALVERLRRGTWTPTTGIDPSGSAGATLVSVSCSSATRCLALGSFDTSGSVGILENPLTETLAHGTWTPSEQSALPFDSFSGASCSSARSCVAVSGDSALDCIEPDLCATVPGDSAIATFTTEGWSAIHLAGPPDASLTGVSCPTTGTCTAVGTYLDAADNEHVATETLADGTWTPVTVTLDTPLLASPSVSCTGDTCVMVSGDTAAASSGGWTVTTVPADPDGHIVNLSSISCTAATSCLAVGDPAGQGSALIVATLSSSGWTTTDLPDPPDTTGGNLVAISCLAATSCVAVGSADVPGPAALVESLSGTAWTPTVLTPPTGDADAELTGVTCAPTTTPSCVAVGTAYGSGGGNGFAMTAALSGDTWSTAAGYADGDASSLTGVACATATTCVAVGSDLTGQPATPLALALASGAWTAQSVALPTGAVGGLLTGASCPASCTGVGWDEEPWSTVPGYDATYPVVATDS